ncbi:hypothetical protein ACFPM0_32415 [Pseudonocardia sulfidoxydans]|uniref:hypothetical protein n=1 Tax=Pseudonocardia sulfidoxydans TaxID=54011 RepID=UPI003618D069
MRHCGRHGALTTGLTCLSSGSSPGERRGTGAAGSERDVETSRRYVIHSEPSGRQVRSAESRVRRTAAPSPCHVEWSSLSSTDGCQRRSNGG